MCSLDMKPNRALICYVFAEPRKDALKSNFPLITSAWGNSISTVWTSELFLEVNDGAKYKLTFEGLP